MTKRQLLDNFRVCLRYKTAKSWQKPGLNPHRFLANQWRKHGLPRPPVGRLRMADAFHLPRFAIVTGEAVSEQIASYGIYEERLTEAFLRLMKPGQVALDIGMHLGYYSTLFAQLVGEEGQVHAFEPTPSTCDLAKRNVGQFPRIIVHSCALWSSVRTLPFHDYGLEWMAFNSFADARLEARLPEPAEIQVNTTTLDQFRSDLGRPVDLVKIDAESAEKEILAGAMRFLKLDRPILTLEVGDFAGNVRSQELLEMLRAEDYHPWEYVAGSFKPHQLQSSYTYDNLILAPAAVDLALY